MDFKSVEIDEFHKEVGKHFNIPPTYVNRIMNQFIFISLLLDDGERDEAVVINSAIHSCLDHLDLVSKLYGTNNNRCIPFKGGVEVDFDNSL